MLQPAVPVTVQQRLDDFRQLSRMQAGSLILSVFGDAVLPRGGRLWLGSLIGLLEPLGLNERLIRTTVFRLVKDEWLTTQAQGRRTDYMLTPGGRRRFEEASRQIYAAEAPAWDHRWRLVLVVGELEAKQRERLRRALFWQGFGDLGAAGFVHPSADLDAAFHALATDGMGDVRGSLMPLVAARHALPGSAADADMVHLAWNLEALAGDYSAFVQRYQPMLDELQPPGTRLDGASAFQTRTLLIHDFRRLLLRDPELPAVLLPPDWPGRQARDLCKRLYEVLLAPSEHHLDQHMQLASGEVPPALAVMAGRFRQSEGAGG
jgi:phenylacetic acid degradation operon negative regulatory protein